MKTISLRVSISCNTSDMFNETKLRTEDILNKDNFENWEFIINNILKSLKILKYVNENVEYNR